MSTILNEDIKSNLANHHAFLQELGNFATSVSWTVIDNLQNISWADSGGGVFAFITGSESYLELQSSGEFTNQFLHYRFRGENTGTIQDHEWVQLGAFKAGDSGKDSTSSIHPVQRAASGNANWNLYRYTSMTPNIIPKVFFFGNNYFIIAIVQFDNSYCNYFTFGSLKLFDSTETQASFAGYTATLTSSTFHWFNRNNINPFDFLGDQIFIENQRKPSTEYSCNIVGSINNVSISGLHFRYGHILNVINNFNNNKVRPLMTPIVSIKFDSDGRWRSIGEYPILRIRSEGFALGELIDYGGKKYRVFPNCRQGERVHGIAVRVA